MVTLSGFVVKSSDGVLLIAQPLKLRLSKRKMALSIIAAEVAEAWLNEKKNKSIISNQLFQSLLVGTAPGTVIETDCLCMKASCKSCVKAVIRARREQKIKGENYGGANQRRKVYRARHKA